MREKVKVAVTQISPVFMDKEATVDKTCKAIEEAGRGGAELDQEDRCHIKAYLDALGHYACWDVLRLDLRGTPNQPFTEAPEIQYSKVKEVVEKHKVDPDILEKMLRELE